MFGRFQKSLQTSSTAYFLGGFYGLSIVSGIWEYRLKSNYQRWKEKHDEFYQLIGSIDPELPIPADMAVVPCYTFTSSEHLVYHTTREMYRSYGYYKKLLEEILERKIDQANHSLQDVEKRISEANHRISISPRRDDDSTNITEETDKIEHYNNLKKPSFTYGFIEHDYYENLLGRLKEREVKQNDATDSGLKRSTAITSEQFYQCYMSQVKSRDSLFKVGSNTPLFKVDKEGQFRYTTSSMFRMGLIGTALVTSGRYGPIIAIIISSTFLLD
jgi:hypothetical protein